MSMSIHSDATSEAFERGVSSSGLSRWEQVIYGVMMVGSFTAFGYLIALECSAPRNYGAIAAFAVAALASQWRSFGVVIPLLILWSIACIDFFSTTTLINTPLRYLLVCTGVLSIVAALRYRTVAQPVAKLMASTRMNYTPQQAVNSLSKSQAATKRGYHLGNVGFGHLLTLPLLVGAWWLAGYLSTQLVTFAASRRAYRAAYQILDGRIGLVPEWYVGVKILFTLTIAIWIVRQIFDYLALQHDDPSVANMHLRSELWRWDGSEQRMVGQQLGKARRRKAKQK